MLKIVLIAAIVLVIVPVLNPSFSEESNAVVPYPVNYRSWVHVKTAIIGPESPAYATTGGFHHIYANEKAMEGYRGGKFPEGSVAVFDVLEAQENKGVTKEGPRKHIDVMVKDSQRFARTSGWGFEEFRGDSQTERSLTEDAKSQCATCHSVSKERDAIISAFRK